MLQGLTLIQLLWKDNVLKMITNLKISIFGGWVEPGFRYFRDCLLQRRPTLSVVNFWATPSQGDLSHLV